MLTNTSITALEAAITPEGIVLYLAVLCVLTFAAIAVGTALRNRKLR